MNIFAVTTPQRASSFEEKAEKNKLLKNNIAALMQHFKKDEPYLLANSGIYITPDEIRDSISDFTKWYTGDFINLLAYRFNEREKIKVYAANNLENLTDVLNTVNQQQENFAFIPLNIAYSKTSLIKNHWVAIIIDKKNKYAFYLDPAQNISKQLSILLNKFNQNVIFNPINFQMKEIKEGELLHCGVYVVEMFNCFYNAVLRNQAVSGSSLPSINSPHETCLQTIFSSIPCGEADSITAIREKHIKETITFLSSKSSVLDNSKVAFSITTNTDFNEEKEKNDQPFFNV